MVTDLQKRKKGEFRTHTESQLLAALGVAGASGVTKPKRVGYVDPSKNLGPMMSECADPSPRIANRCHAAEEKNAGQLRVTRTRLEPHTQRVLVISTRGVTPVRPQKRALECHCSDASARPALVSADRHMRKGHLAMASSILTWMLMMELIPTMRWPLTIKHHRT